MGSFRRRLTTAAVALVPGPTWAGCAALRPAWDGAPVTVWDEFLWLLQTPVVLILILATAIAIRFRSEKAGLAVVVGWSIATYLVTGWGQNDPDRLVALVEGCIGSPALFVGFAVLLSIGTVLYTAPLSRRKE